MLGFIYGDNNCYRHSSHIDDAFLEGYSARNKSLAYTPTLSLPIYLNSLPLSLKLQSHFASPWTQFPGMAGSWPDWATKNKRSPSFLKRSCQSFSENAQPWSRKCSVVVWRSSGSASGVSAVAGKPFGAAAVLRGRSTVTVISAIFDPLVIPWHKFFTPLSIILHNNQSTPIITLCYKFWPLLEHYVTIEWPLMEKRHLSGRSKIWPLR